MVQKYFSTVGVSVIMSDDQIKEVGTFDIETDTYGAVTDEQATLAALDRLDMTRPGFAVYGAHVFVVGFDHTVSFKGITAKIIVQGERPGA
ncbi:hypothetical protein GCM10008955_01350 [Deinococcus malanensis]|uniref:Uncharacterized protein n=2 Tax=Deinococcus malanensis TaxID=1706855 RepID=A0ABQ2EH27_9DEIO|nr:hypothetical protein [Deinococcus malanensis]GGK11846.1 hypothetical protein GCM10008955_01350 [Deinococcus malanensis]